MNQMDVEEANNEEEANEEEEEEYNYQEDNDAYYDEWNEEPLYTRPSKDKAYDVYEVEEIAKHIYQENKDKQMLTCLPAQWNLMLYYFCDFKQTELFSVLDQEQTGRKMIRFDEEYLPLVTIDTCMVCCSEDVELVINACSHSFCFECWKDYLQANHSDRKLYELFPMCPYEGCYFRTNLLMMEKVWERYPQQRKEFDKLLCLRYSQKSAKIKLCRREGCSKAMMINLPTGRTLACTCGNQICRICGENDHFPSSCGDVKTWARIVDVNQSQWLHQIVTQQCPMCKMPIDKNGGCIHMTCKCGHSFCWICLKFWKGHTNYGECDSVKKEDHERKLLDEQEKRKSNDGYYSVKFQEAKSEVERAESMSKRVASLDMEAVIKELNQYHILTNDLLRLKEVKEVIIEALAILIYSHVYIFFEREGYLLLKRDLEFYAKLMSKLDDFLQERAHSVDIVSGKLEKVNGKKVEMGQILMEEVKKHFFLDWDHHIDLLSNVRKLTSEIKEGKFMMGGK